MGYQRLPVGAFGVAGVDGDDAAAGSVEIGVEPEDGAIIVDKGILGFEDIDQFHYGRIGLGKVFVIEAVLRRRVFDNGDDEIAAVIADAAAKHHLFDIRALVDQFVFGLSGAEAVEIELLEIIGIAQGGAGGLVVTAVVETFAVFGPGCAGEFHPLEIVGEIFAGVDVADVPLVPVGAGSGDAISH